jgi:hypothetical protein
MNHQQPSPAIVPVDPKQGSERTGPAAPRRTFMPRIKFGRRTFGGRFPSRRTFGFRGI